MTALFPPGKARREAMEARGQNISRRDFTDEEWADLQAKAAAAKRMRAETPGTPFPPAAEAS